MSMQEKYGLWRKNNKRYYNTTFCILSSLAIIMVVAGHVGYNIMTVGDLFPYYSFHVPLFMFISGYFYKESEEETPFFYIIKKICRLLVPYLIWNLIYGLIAWALRTVGFAMGEEIGFRTLFIAPFMHGYQFIYNYAAWFVPVLFIVEILNLFARLILHWFESLIASLFQRRNDNNSGVDPGYMTDWVMLIGSLIVGMATVWLAIGGHVWGDYKAAGRILFLFPCFQMGCFYKRKLEKHDTLGNVPYFTIVLSIQVLLNVCCNGLAFSAVWCTGFANGPIIPYVTVVSGIAFWLRIARVLAPIAQDSKTVRYLGQNTYAVMLHHVIVFMLIKAVIAGIAACTGLCEDFDFAQFYANIDYYYLVRGGEQFKMVYLAAGVVLPLLLQRSLSGLGQRFMSYSTKLFENKGGSGVLR